MSTKNKKAAEQPAADLENKVAESTASDVTNSNEAPEFSKTAKNSKESERVSEIGPSEQMGASVQTKDAEKVAKEQRKEAAENTEVLEVFKPVEFSFEKKDYIFANDAPEKIRVFKDEVYSQTEIAKNEELLVHLIGGGSGLIKQKF